MADTGLSDTFMVICVLMLRNNVNPVCSLNGIQFVYLPAGCKFFILFIFLTVLLVSCTNTVASTSTEGLREPGDNKVKNKQWRNEIGVNIKSTKRQQ